MSKKRSEASRGEEPPEINDLKLINGIGPAVERRLHGVGIYTYAQLAALSPADVASAVAGIGGLTSERIIKQDWIGQARRLASESIPGEAQEEAEAPVEPFVSQVELVAPAIEITGPAPPVVAETELAVPSVEVTEPAPAVVTPSGAEEADIPPPVVAITGMPRLHLIETISADTNTLQNFFARDQPFIVRLTLDLSDVRVSDDTQISYRVSIYSKSLEGHPRQIVGEISGIVTSTDKVIASIEGIALPKGTYRLKAMLILNPMTTKPLQQLDLVASQESDLLLIF
jgi:Helix-hairpin-helix domain